MDSATQNILLSTEVTVPSNQTADSSSFLVVMYALLPLIILLMVTTIVGNILVMICVRIDKRLASTISSIYVFSMAGADLVVGLFVMGGMAVYTVYGFWPLGHLWCLCWVITDFMCCTVSMLHLCLIAYDRYEAIVHPIDYRQNRSAANATYRALGAWIVGMLAWLPATITFTMLFPGPENDCFYLPPPLYVLIQSLIVYWGLIVLMAIFYVKCLHKLRLRYAKTVATGGVQGPKLFLAAEGTTTTTDGTVTEGEGTQGQDAQGQATSNAMQAVSQLQLNKQQQQLRSIRTLGVVMVVFLFCWIPFCSFWPVMAYCPTCINARLYEYSYWAAYINSCVNPFLYFLSNRDFRNAFMTLIGHKQKA